MLTNPFYYPIAILCSGIVLIVGVRWLRLPNVIMLPTAAVVATATAAVLKSRQTGTASETVPVLKAELSTIRQQAQQIADKAEILRQEAESLLTGAFQLELLTAVQYACDGAAELPQKIDPFIHRFNQTDSLLSVEELQQQLAEARKKQQNSSGVAYHQLSQLIQGLQRNIQLVEKGEDARQAQIISLSNIITELAGTLQQLQNQLRTSDLDNLEEQQTLRSLSEDISRFQENVGVLIAGN